MAQLRSDVTRVAPRVVAAPRRVLHLLQEQLAISRQTSNQLLKELEAQGILRLTYGEIEELLDLPRLRQAAQ